MSKKEAKQEVVSPEEMSAFLRSKTNQHDTFQAPKPCLKIKRLRDNDLPLPEYKTKGSAGMDLMADLTKSLDPEKTEPVDPSGVRIVHPGRSMLISTGLSIELPNGFEAQVRSRSGLALKNQVVVLNSPGTVDADYRGEVGVILFNHGSKPFVVHHGDRIAQLVIAKVEQLPQVEVTETSKTERGEGGFGSTGVK